MFLLITIALAQILPFKLPQMYPCFLFGVFLRKVDFLNRLNNTSSVWLLFLFIVLYLFFDSTFLDSNLRASVLKLMDGNCGPFVSEISRRCFRLLVGIVGALAVISCTKSVVVIVSKLTDINRLSLYGTQTQAIYILHGPIMIFILSRFLCFDNISYFSYSYIVCPVISLALMLVSLLVINCCSSAFRKYIFGSTN